MKSAAKTSDLAGFIGFDEAGVQVMIGGKNGMSPGKVWLPAMEEVLQVRERPADPSTERGFTQALELLLGRPRQLVFIIDTFQHLNDEELDKLLIAARRHEVVCLRLSDLRERELPAAPLFSWLPLPAFLDVRTAAGEREVLLASPRNRRRHAQQFDEQEAKTREVLAASGCKYAHFGTEESPEVTQEKLITVLKSTRSQPVLV